MGTATLVGSGDLENRYWWENSVGNGWTDRSLVCGNHNATTKTFFGAMRVIAGSIPAGTITAAVWDAWQVAGAQSANGGDLDMHAMKNDADWTDDGATFNTENGVDAWPGGAAGGDVQGTDDDPTDGTSDHDNTLSGSFAFSAHTSGDDRQVEITMAAKGRADLVAWRDATRDVNGWHTKVRNHAQISSLFACREIGAGNEPSLAITYTPLGGGRTLGHGLGVGIGGGIG